MQALEPLEYIIKDLQISYKKYHHKINYDTHKFNPHHHMIRWHLKFRLKCTVEHQRDFYLKNLLIIINNNKHFPSAEEYMKQHHIITNQQITTHSKKLLNHRKYYKVTRNFIVPVSFQDVYSIAKDVQNKINSET